MEFAGKNVVITGGARGMGKRFAVHFKALGAKPFVYFANAYYADPVSQTVATCDYQVPFTAAVEAGNVFGVQFHPEKSGPLGLQIMRNFVNL